MPADSPNLDPTEQNMSSTWRNVVTRCRILTVLFAALAASAVPAVSQAAGTAGAHKSEVHRVATVAATVLDLNGTWTYGGLPGPRITAGSTSLTVDMSAYHRPTANGTIVDNATIRVTFPDDATFTGHLEAPNTIRWSNGTTWIKAVSRRISVSKQGAGASTVFVVAGTGFTPNVRVVIRVTTPQFQQVQFAETSGFDGTFASPHSVPCVSGGQLTVTAFEDRDPTHTFANAVVTTCP
jgi:hypothetical protein